MSASTIPDEVRNYLATVRERLDDLPAEDREDLLTDVEPSVIESAEESDLPLELRLGPPERFADELRAAAGLEPRSSGVPVTPGERTFGDRVRAADTYLTSSPNARWLRDLAPLWWVLRGYLAVALFACLSDDGFDGRYPGVPDFGGSDPGLGVAAVAVAVVVSVAIGLRRLRRTPLLVAVNVVLLLGLLLVAGSAGSQWHGTGVVEVQRLERPMPMAIQGGVLETPAPPDLVRVRPVPAPTLAQRRKAVQRARKVLERRLEAGRARQGKK